MAKIRRIDFSPDEFLVGVADLKHDEIGPYWVACSLMYSRGGPIADDDAWIARACGCHWRTWRRIKERLIEVGKLRVTPEGLINDRVVKELAKAQGRLKTSSDAAQASARIRAERAAASDDQWPEEPDRDPLRNGARLPQDARRTAAGCPQDGFRNGADASQDAEVSAKNNNLGRAPAQNPNELTINHQPSTTNYQLTVRTEAAPSASPREAASAADDDAGPIPDFLRADRASRTETDEAYTLWVPVAYELSIPDPGFLNSERRSELAARLAECGGIEGWKLALENLRAAEFLRDDDDPSKPKHWVNLKNLCKSENFIGLMEGRYAERRSPQSRSADGGPPTVADGVAAAFARRYPQPG